MPLEQNKPVPRFLRHKFFVKSQRRIVILSVNLGWYQYQFYGMISALIRGTFPHLSDLNFRLFFSLASTAIKTHAVPILTEAIVL